MDKIDFDDMTGKNKVLYEALWKGVNFDAPIEQTWNEKYEKYSSNSYSFSKASLLINIFNIKNPTLFETKYKMAVGGSGNEGDKITTLHSSSLCALLHFYNVTKDNPLTLTVNGREIEFIDSIFEFKSPVIDPRYPSNMDVVLIGKEYKDNGKDVVLFLESKFAEYYLDAGTSSGEISNEYLNNKYTRPLYYDIGYLGKNLSQVKDNTRGKFTLKSTETFYIKGIKQMISHYCGIRNLIDLVEKGRNKDDVDKKYPYFEGNNSEKDEKIHDILMSIKNGALVILGEIVFDHKIGNFKVPLRGNERKECFKVYSGKYGALAKEIASLTKDVPNFEIVTELLKYSDIKKIMEYKMEDKIKAFYYGK